MTEEISKDTVKLFMKAWISDDSMSLLANAIVASMIKDSVPPQEAMKKSVDIFHVIAGDKVVETFGNEGKLLEVKLGDLMVQQLKVAVAKAEATKDLWYQNE